MELAILSVCFFALLFTCAISTDTISTNQTIRDGETIISAEDTFELGFFSTSNTSQNRYLGIWYKQFATGTVVWVANRETPISNKSGVLILKPGGLLVLRDSSNNQIIWSSKSSTDAGNAVAQLLDNSNFRVVDSVDRSENYIWQSFDHPGNTYMPEMKFGRNLRRGVVTNYTSWKSDDDPSQGQYMIYMDFNGLLQVFLKNRDVILWRHGSWNGIAFSGSTSNQPDLARRKSFYSDDNEISSEYVLINQLIPMRIKLTPSGIMERWNWNNRTHEWFLYWSLTTESCQRYALCGVHGICDSMQAPNCGCLSGFIPKRPDAWKISDWTSGCQRVIPLDCGVGEGFRKYSFIKIPDTRQSWFDRNMTVEQCKVKCTNECNCTAYATLDIELGTGCLLWYNELIDMRTLPDNGQDLYIRLAAIELEKDKRISGSKKKVWVIVIPVCLGFVGLLGLCIYIIIKKKVKAPGRHYPIGGEDALELPMFSLSTLSTATDNFSISNKLGEGGFGPVYMGFLENGWEIAVKRLSLCSTQGVQEFKNEVIFISKLQHRNLVKILGYCIEGEEKLLVYEYMSNKGLDLYIYQEANRLNWSKLIHILNGIARGLVYLHQDSRLRIIHRDLKAANILLDHDMNPKISDFGLARSFGGNESKTKTTRVVGTYGYMSPEYAGNGIISVKTDVFSFGVLVLEIVSGKRNRGFSHEAHSHNLLGHAWRLYKEKKSLELVDASSLESNQVSEVLCSIQVGLLCVQHNPDDRPEMSMVVAMLNGEDRLPEPKHPGFYTEETSETVETQCSNIDVTVTLLEAR